MRRILAYLGLYAKGNKAIRPIMKISRDNRAVSTLDLTRGYIGGTLVPTKVPPTHMGEPGSGISATMTFHPPSLYHRA